MSQTGERPLTTDIKLAYAVPAFALAVVGIPVYVYIPKFYTDVIGIDMAAMGTLLFGVRLFDAITDPAIGSFSDATRTRWGRRRPFIFFGALLLALAIILLFVPPDTTADSVTVWFGVFIYLLFLFWTIVTVPYESLGPEITHDYHQRTSLFGLRDGFLIAGTLAAAASPAIIEAFLGLENGPDDQRRKFLWMAGIYAPLVVLTCWWCVFRLREKPSPASQPRVFDSISLKGVLRNRPFLVLVGAYTISAVGNNLPATLILFYVQYVLRSSHADFFLMLYFVTGILMLPFWISLSKRIGKKYAWVVAMALNTGAFTGVFFLGAGDEVAYGLLVALSGIGFGATLALPSSIQADVIDYDELLTGRRREGLYIGMWSVSKKFAAAAGVGIGLWVLGAVGYTPNVEQSERVLLTLRALYALVPSICNIAGILIVMAYPINDSLHGRIHDAIQQRRGGRRVIDPLTGCALRPFSPSNTERYTDFNGQAINGSVKTGKLQTVGDVRATERIKYTEMTPGFCSCSRRIIGCNLVGCGR